MLEIKKKKSQGTKIHPDILDFFPPQYIYFFIIIFFFTFDYCLTFFIKHLVYLWILSLFSEKIKMGYFDISY